jgi:hypothetical protein
VNSATSDVELLAAEEYQRLRRLELGVPMREARLVSGTLSSLYVAVSIRIEAGASEVVVAALRRSFGKC